MAIEPDSKAKYIKLAKNTIIASVLITLALTFIEIPKDYFGGTVQIADEGLGDPTFAKIEDKDAQNREVVTINGRRYVVTDTGKTITSTQSIDGSLKQGVGLYGASKTIKNVSFLRPFGDCQDFWKGFYASIDYYRDSDGFVFPSSYSYDDYINAKEEKEKQNQVNAEQQNQEKVEQQKEE
ncbi:MAG: hypothetical protein IJJ82_05900 [Clostridia bacterium]|nr:hypothetical protein [Clostridia bacterium]